MSQHTNGQSTNRAPLIVFGKMGSKRPHAAWFRAEDTEVATWVARRLGLSILKAKSSAARTIIGSLSEWTLNEAGQPVIPVVKCEILALLDIKAISASDEPHHANRGAVREAKNGCKPSIHPQDPRLREYARKLWDTLTVNTLVLAREADPTHGWWEAVILAEHDGVFTLYFRDYPHQGLVKRDRQQIALLPPAG